MSITLKKKIDSSVKPNDLYNLTDRLSGETACVGALDRVSRYENPRLLIVTPEVSRLPAGMGKFSKYLCAGASCVADVWSNLIRNLYDYGVDVHIALPDYRKLFKQKLPPDGRRQMSILSDWVPEQKIHLAKDRGFFYLDRTLDDCGQETMKLALYFQREVLNHIIPHVQPDLIHCNDWMTGLIPAAARKLGIPCLFTLHNLFSMKCPLSCIEDIGIDAASFWQNLFYERYPWSYEETRDSNPVNLLSSAVFAADYVNTMSPAFLNEIINGEYDWINPHIRCELLNRLQGGSTSGVLNAPDPSYNPLTDKFIFHRYGVKNHHAGKKYNKLYLQERLGLMMNSQAPVFFWPSRFDPFQTGYHLLAVILQDVMGGYREQNLQMVLMVSGEYKKDFNDRIQCHRLLNRVSVCDFDEELTRQAYAGSDFILMPSRFDPCGLPQMIGALYGALPVAYDTGGVQDTVIQMDVVQNRGNGFLFKNFDAGGLYEAINKAMQFYNLAWETQNQQIERIMVQSMAIFNQAIATSKYLEIYEEILKRPVFQNEISKRKYG